MTERERSLAMLERIAVGVERLVAIAERKRSGAEAGASVAPDRDLDSEHGDPQVRFDPRDWTGGSMKGRRFSQCPADFLELLAEVLEHFAAGESDPKKASYKRKDAARARGWMVRIREGKHQAPAATAGGDATAQGDDAWAGDPSW